MDYRVGHVLDVLRAMPEASVHCCVTSPPYWGLRSYQGDQERVWGDGWRGALGLEPAPELFVQHLVEVFREVRRVLRSDGVVWCNLGDSYCTVPHGPRTTNTTDPMNPNGRIRDGPKPNRTVIPGFKHKDLMGMPWRVAFALQAGGWWLRSDIIWSKVNPMPESIRDRPTKSHEYIFLLAKSDRYFYDADAVREPPADSTMARWKGKPYHKRQNEGYDPYFDFETKARQSHEGEQNMGVNEAGRNLRTVWTIATRPYAAAHFATFSPELVEVCIKAGTSEKGCCATCGAPWERVIESTGHVNRREPAHVPGNTPTKTDSTGWGPTTKSTTRWSPACDHGGEPIPCTVLDPFAGSGTTLGVAKALGRSAIGIDISDEYQGLAKARIASIVKSYQGSADYERVRTHTLQEYQ